MSVNSASLLMHEDDIMSSVMPEEIKDDYPNSFSIVGHVGPPSIPRPLLYMF